MVDGGWLGHLANRSMRERDERPQRAFLPAWTSATPALRRLRAQADASAYLQAVVLAGMRRRDEAFVLLERAVDRREDAVPDLGVDPSLDALRDDPRMDALLRRAGLSASAPRG